MSSASGDIMYVIYSNDLTRPGITQIYGRELLGVCLNPDKFGFHRHSDNGDVFNLSRNLKRSM